MLKKEWIVVLAALFIVSWNYVEYGTPTLAVDSAYGVEPVAMIQVPEYPQYAVAVIKPDGDTGIQGLVLEKMWLWWRIRYAAIPGIWERQSANELSSSGSSHFSYVAAIEIPGEGEQSGHWILLGEATSDVASVQLETDHELLQFTPIPYGLTKYYYFSVAADEFSLERLKDSLRIRLEDGRVVQYPFMKPR